MPPSPLDPEPCIAAPFTARSEDGGARFVVERHGDGAQFDLSAGAVHILRMANRFREPAAHLTFLEASAWPGGQPVPPREDLTEILHHLLHLGLLRTRTKVLSGMCAQPRDPEPPPPITVCAWVTRNRPGLLLRSVESLLRHNRNHGREVDYHVYDDSTEPGVQEEVRAGLETLARTSGARILHIGAVRKRAYLTDLVREGAAEGIPPEVIRFAMEPPLDEVFAAGGNQNAVLLGTLGELALCSDDDIVFEPARLAGGSREHRLALSSAYSPTVLWPEPDMASVRARVRPEAVDLLGAHEALLGRTVSGLLEGISPERVALDAASTALCGRLEQAGGRVLVTCAGAYGDTGMGNQRMLLTLEGPAREAVMTSEARYRETAANHLAVNMAETPSLSKGIALFAMNLGLDNRVGLPPFMPRYRGHDPLFAALLRRALPSALIGYLPLGLLHQPDPPRRLPHDLIHESAPNFGGFLMLLIEAFQMPPRVQDPTQHQSASLEAMGQHLETLAALHPADFRHLVQERWEHHALAMASHLEGLLERYGGSPDFWARDLSAYRVNLLASTDGKGGAGEVGALSLELREDPEQGWARAQDLVGCYGRLLGYWPALTALAMEMKNQGRGLA